jgi:predicted nucleic acid-binding protein
MICLDANIVIELLLKRRLAQKCRDYITAVNDDIAITVLSVSIIMYYAEAKQLDLLAVERFLRDFVWLAVVETDTTWAFQHFAGKDFEDALQIATAKREGCQQFVTLDRALAKKHIATMPVELLS